MNLGMYIGAASLIVSLTLAFLWQSEKTKNAELQGSLNISEQHILTLKSNIEMLNSQVTESMKLVDINANLQSKFDQDITRERIRVEKLQNEINNLRAKELEDAMQDPFNRGNSATERWNNVMQLISEREGAKIEGSNNSGFTEGSDSRTTDSTRD